MSDINSPNPTIDRTVQIFDKFYNYNAGVPASEYDVVYSYFESVFGTSMAAQNFTTTLFRIANQTNVPVMVLLQQMQGQSAPQITLTMAYYINTNSSPSTMLGLNAVATPNYYVARNIVA